MSERELVITDDDSDYIVFNVVMPTHSPTCPTALWVAGVDDRELHPVHLNVDNLRRLIDYFTSIRNFLEEE